MKKSHITFVGLSVLVLVVGLAYYFFPQEKTQRQSFKMDPAFSNYISSFTYGTISSSAQLKIKFVNEFDGVTSGMTEERNLFEISPSVQGHAIWENKSTLVFVPDERLVSGEDYAIQFNLKPLFDDIDSELQVFSYAINIIPQNFELKIDNIQAYEETDLSNQQISGVVLTSDIVELQSMQDAFQAQQDGQDLTVLWQSSPDKRMFKFTVENVTRKEEEEEVALSLDGSEFGSDKQLEEGIEIPALGDFSVRDVRVIQSEPQYVEIRFSDPLKKDQNLEGLIQISGTSDLDFQIESNKVLVYLKERPSGDVKIVVEEDVKNILNYKLNDGISEMLSFVQLKPALKLTTEGNILPASKGLILPFEAVALKAVEVEVIKIMEPNVLQFLQVNELGGNSQLRRVGKPILKKTINLQKAGVTDIAQWNNYVLDLETLMVPEQGAIYQIRMSFKRRHAAFYCGGEADEGLYAIEEENNLSDEEQEFSNWDSYENYYYGDDYNWRDRDNPCSNSYYNSSKSVKVNILASNVGLIVKSGQDRSYLAVVTDMLTAKPIENADVRLYNYQMELLEQRNADANGFVEFSPKEKPYFVVATNGKEKAYIKLNNGKALSVSGFDVGGSKVKKGIKGFMYGERGVWRPGDSIYYAFILKDPKNNIPLNHPVVFELKNPKGKIAQRLVQTKRTGNIYKFATATRPSDPTGNWSAEVKVGGVTFHQNVKIETVKPNRLKIKAVLEDDKKVVLSEGIKGQINVAWLHGAVGSNLKSTVELILKERSTKFKKYEDYCFDNPTVRLYSEKYNIFEGTTDASGDASFNYRLSDDIEAPGVLSATFITKAFEEGGNYSIDAHTLPMYTYNSYVGIKKPKGDKRRGMLLTDTTHVFNLVNLNPDGKLKSTDQFDVSVFKLDWKWWWDKSEDNLTNYVNSNYYTPIIRKRVGGDTGKGKFKFKIKYPEWGRYLVKACNGDGHCTGQVVYVDWPGWAGRAQRDSPDGAAMLSFNSDKPAYSVGEKVNVTLPGSDNGRALITIENGSGVVGNFWVDTKAGDNKFDFEVTDRMTPNIYVHAMLIQPHQNTLNDHPIRMYGLLPLDVSDPKTVLKPKLTVPKEVEPGDKMSMRVEEQNGEPMRYTLAVVDEGLLDLTRFKTPDPWKYFYAKEALGVKTWDVYDQVIGAYKGELSRLLALGGDEEMEKSEEEADKRFKSVVKFFGPFELESGQSAEHNFEMPQYVGSVKVMLVAENDQAFGRTDEVTKVKQSLMVLGTLPRVLSVGEQVELPVNLFLTDKKHSTVKVHLELEGAVQAVQASKSVQVTGKEHELEYFTLKTGEKSGKAKVKIVAESKGKKSTHEIDIEIRNPNPFVSKTKFVEIQPGGTADVQWNAIGVDGSNAAKIEISSFPAINLEKRLRYLIRYPYGCLEQTTSSALPQLYIKKFVDLSAAQSIEIDNNINAAVERLQQFQLPDGGFAYWPGQENVNAWANTYAGYFILKAEKEGYPIPYQMKDQWIKYQKKSAKNWRKQATSKWDTYIQSYRLYTLALAGKPDRASMNRLRERNDLNAQTKWMLAWAYNILGEKLAAEHIIEGVAENVATYNGSGATYGSPLRDNAIAVSVLVDMEKREQAGALIKKITGELADSKKWFSTQTTSFCLQAVSDFYQMTSGAKPMEFAFAMNEEADAAVTSNRSFYSYGLKVNQKGANTINIENNGEGILFATVVYEGQPLAGTEEEEENNIVLRSYYLDNNNQPLEIDALKQGADFYAVVEVVNPGLRGVYENLALSQVFPSGWEIQNSRLFGNEATIGLSYQDIRDDRVHSFFDLAPNEKKTIKIKLNASYKGSYYLPALKVEAMYDNTIKSIKKGRKITIQ